MLTGQVPFKDLDPLAVVWVVGSEGETLPIPSQTPKLVAQLMYVERMQEWMGDVKTRAQLMHAGAGGACPCRCRLGGCIGPMNELSAEQPAEYCVYVGNALFVINSHPHVL